MEHCRVLENTVFVVFKNGLNLENAYKFSVGYCLSSNTTAEYAKIKLIK